jgi:hypothetical protein
MYLDKQLGVLIVYAEASSRLFTMLTLQARPPPKRRKCFLFHLASRFGRANTVTGLHDGWLKIEIDC